MAQKLNLSDRIFEFLKNNPEQRYTAFEIAKWVLANYPNECSEKRNKSKQVFETDDDFLWVLASEVGVYRERVQAKHPEIKATEGRPRKLYYTDKSEVDEAEAAEIPINAPSPGSDKLKKRESDLYRKLHNYLRDELKVYAKRIDEKTSSNNQGKRGNHWIHPDVVGIENLAEEWDQEVRDCVGVSSAKRSRLWSFEVKLLINRSNLRECFFQAVSNSSWANLGYLVAGEITGKGTLTELRMLSVAHGIGFIELDYDNPNESQISIPAVERSEVNWDAANRLARENSDFKSFLKLVKQFYQIGEIKPNDWPEPTDDDAID
jgi:hypothetical protein